MDDLRIRRWNGSSVTVNDQRYIIKKEIGAGGSHLIYLAEPERNPIQKVVIREFYPISAAAQRDEQGNLVFDKEVVDAYREEFRREQDNTIVVTGEMTQAAAVWSADLNTFCAVMQLFSNDSKTLYELLTEWEKNPPDKDITRLYISLNVISALLSSLVTLHTNAQRLHCDLSCYNVKVSGNVNDFQRGDHLSAQIFDFGSMVETDTNHYYTANSMEKLPAATPAFRPCEMEGCSTVLSPATDLYSVAALLYGLVCGLSCNLFLWEGLNVSNHQWMVRCDFFAVEDDLDALRLSSTVRSSLFRILKQGMALDPQERYQTALEMQSDIDHLANWIRPFQIDDLRDEMYRHNQSIHDHNGIYHLGVQHEVTPTLFSKLCDPENGQAAVIASDDHAPSLYHYLKRGWNRDEPFQHLILSGEGGSGKTTSLLETAALLQEEAVPVLYVPLNTLTAKDDPLGSYLKNVVFPSHENALGVLRECCGQEPNERAVPQVVFFLDGINEISDSIRSTVIDEIQAWMGYQNLQIVVAGRSDISHYQAFFKENTPHLQLQPLEKAQVEQYLEAHGLLPADDAAVSVLYNPLMLVLYVNTAQYQRENPRQTAQFRPELTQGAILWNYIEAQVLKTSTQNSDRKQRYARNVAAHYLAAWIGWTMGDQYALNETELTDTLEGFLKQHERWKQIPDLKNYRIRTWEPELYELEKLLTEELCILAVNQGMYSFQHQIFRDYYAAAAMEHDALLPNPEQSELWKCEPSYSWSYVCDLLAGLLTAEKMDKIWNSMRDVDVAQRSYSMYKLVAVLAARNGDDLSDVDFSEMDLRTVSLAGKRIDAKDKKMSFKKAKIGGSTFVDDKLPQVLSKIKASPDGKILAIIGDGKGCFMDVVTGRVVATFSICGTDTKDLCWSTDSSFISFWSQEFRREESYCNYFTVDLAGNVRENNVEIDRKRPISIRCGQTHDSIIKLFDEYSCIHLQDYSFRIETNMDTFGFSVHYAWSFDGTCLFLAQHIYDFILSSINQKRYRLICFNLEKDRIIWKKTISVSGMILTISCSPNGKYLVIQTRKGISTCGHYLMDVQERKLIDLQIEIGYAVNGVSPFWTADGSCIVLYDSSRLGDEVFLFRLDSMSFQKIQLHKMTHGEIMSMDSFVKGNECYLAYFGYEYGEEGYDWSSPPKKTFFEIYCLNEKKSLPIYQFEFWRINKFNWIKNARELTGCLSSKNQDILWLNIKKKSCENFELPGENRKKCLPSGQKIPFQAGCSIDGEISCSPTGKYAARNIWGELSVHDLNGELIFVDTDCISDMLEWAPDEHYMLYVKYGESLRNKVMKLDLKRRKSVYENVSLDSPFTYIAWAYKKNLLAYTHSNVIYLCPLEQEGFENPLQHRIFYQCDAPICQISFSPDEEYLACYDEMRFLYILNIEDHYGHIRIENPLHTADGPLYWKFKPIPGMNLVNADFTGAKFSDEETRELIRQNGGIMDDPTVEAPSSQTGNSESNETRNE